MIAHELILLGLLKASPKHGYEIKKEIKEILFLFTGVEVKSIYYPMSILEKKGFVQKRVIKIGNRPVRYVYELTKKGRDRFQSLLSKSFLDFKRPQFSLDQSLYFLENINPAIARRRLQARIYVLKRLSRSLSQMVASCKKNRPASLGRILDHNLQMVETESRFLKELIGTL